MHTLTDTQQVTLSINNTTKKGHPAAIDGVPVWASSDPDVVGLEVAADGLSARVFATNNLGSARVTATADTRVGPDVLELVAMDDFEVIAGEGVALGFSAGTVEEQADAPTP